MKKLIALVCLSGALFATARARAADECVAEATRVANAKEYGEATFFDAPDKPTALKLTKACAPGTPCPTVYFAREKLALEIPAGYQPQDENKGGPSGHFAWTNVPPKADKCKALLVARFDPVTKSHDSAPTKRTNGATLFRWRPASRKPAPSEPQAADAAERSTASDADFMQKSLTDYRTLRTQQLTGTVAARSTGSAQGLEDVAAEAVQILGQIVVDRASAEGYRLITMRLKKLLGCGEASPPSIAQGQLPKPTFPKTCGALDTLRLEDLATSRDTLVAALLQDVLAYLGQVQASLDEKQLQAEQIGALAVVGSVVTTLLVRPSLPANSAQARLILGALLSYVDRHFPTDPNAKLFANEAERALAAGVLAYTRCDYEAAQNNTKLSDCAFTTYSDAYAGDEPATRIAAGALASELLAVATLSDAQGQPDAAARVIHAVDAILASSCMLLNTPETPAFSCPEPPAKLKLAQLTPLVMLELVKPIVDGALDKDSNAVLMATANAVVMVSDAAADAEYVKSRKRALLLLGSLVKYSATYIGQTPGDAAERHDQRTKILESLTEAMSNRTGRDGDDIWSFGGSFRAVGGARFGARNPALASPVGLPLGIGFDHVSDGDNATFHLELSPLDLGQYVAFDNRGVVKKPKFEDVVLPSVTLGVGIGRSLPLVFGATCGYSPTFQLAPPPPGQTAKRGAVTVGLTAGIYVPLIDMN